MVKRKNILAHRGLWSNPDEKNTYSALLKALKLGFGIETDFRDLGGQLVVSHDPPLAEHNLFAQQIFSAYSRLNCDGRVAMNIKADGLQTVLSNSLTNAGITLENVFAFDMSVPDTLGYLDRGIPTYSRQSEFETQPAFLDRAAGVWVDDFSGDFPQVEHALTLLKAGHRVALVSPELHKRDPADCWADIKASGLHHFPTFELCTDLPEAAFEMLGEQP